MGFKVKLKGPWVEFILLNYQFMFVDHKFGGQNIFLYFRVCGVFLIDSHFMVDGGKFISGAMAALSVMVNLEVPHVNVLSKVRTKMQEGYSLL